ncbi:MAG TPA: DHA2 family efflux MFS transporter permease subunit [Solirubrobacteraceae bacterium]|jgi:EmrB/QacA subfamily drug resistance transporter|nr:DHA2 family efflux MFS transporter permease subunit [Solirubrobacteraceae bacterium]
MRTRPGWTFAIVSTALFMVVLDNLVVTTALPSIRADLGATIQSLEWTVNAYTLSYAVLLLTGAALGDRFGRRRMFLLGLGLFTVASAAAALAPSTGALIAARAVQGVGAAVVTPLTLTLLAGAFPAEKRGLAIGAWSGISGLGVALGPLVGGAVVDGISWHWIFWLNVPIGLALLPIAARRLTESHGPSRSLDLPGVALASAGLLGVVYGIVRGAELGWTSATVLGSLTAGAVLLVAFLVWEARTPQPMLPLRLFRSRAFAAVNVVSLAMYFGVFGSIFLLAQFFQVTQGYSPLEAGLRTLPWTGMPMLVAPIAGLLSDRIGSRPLMATGLALQAIAIGWLASVSTPSTPYGDFVVPFVLAGIGMALVFAPAANAVLGAVRPEQAGQASGATNAIRELGGVLGIAVLATVFASHGSYASPQAYTDGMTSAVWVGAAVLAVGALAALYVPGRRPRREAAVGEPVPVPA